MLTVMNISYRSARTTLLSSNVNITQQIITEKKKSLNNLKVYVRSPSSSQTERKFLKATMIDENRNLVKLIDKDISKEPIFLTVQSNEIVYDEELSQSKYYVNFTFNTAQIEIRISILAKAANLTKSWTFSAIHSLGRETSLNSIRSMSKSTKRSVSPSDIL